ncbi:MAG: hypothetical protein OEQ25_18475, partial [Gammaproteobacteria bacterium]|nr:hypothetical protein [Gammaproteobacteria bacterium]
MRGAIAFSSNGEGSLAGAPAAVMGNNGSGRPEPLLEAESEALEANRHAVIAGRFSIRLPNGGVVWATEDPLAIDPRLAIQAPQVVELVEGQLREPIRFTAYTNYAAFIRELELQVYRASDVDRVDPVAILHAAPRSLFAFEWDVTNIPAGEREFTYILQAIGHDGQRDETIAQMITLREGASTFKPDANSFDGPDADAHAMSAAASVYGQTNLAIQNIPIAGSRVRIHGQAIGGDNRLRINGEQLPVDTREKFAVEYFLPVGAHDFAVLLTDPDGNESRYELPIEVTGRYLFVAALADVTASDDDMSGSIEALSDDDSFDDDLLVEGRLALYLKGKIQGRYLLTAQLDTREEELGELFDNIHRKDPESIFRRLDPDRYYPVYGDDSVTISDTNTQGRMYVRLDWDKSQVVWGNYNTGFTGTELAQYNRSLYGARVQHRSEETTDLGEARTHIQAFVSEAQTVLGHSEFLGTGGSLYYLRHTDILPGSEKARVEIRDPDSGRTLETTVLLRGTDYEIDELQGRLILARPLQQITRSDYSIIRDDQLDGSELLLLVDYEYVAESFDTDNLTRGGRVKQWLGDQVAIGATHIDEARAGDDYQMTGADITLQA